MQSLRLRGDWVFFACLCVCVYYVSLGLTPAVLGLYFCWSACQVYVTSYTKDTLYLKSDIDIIVCLWDMYFGGCLCTNETLELNSQVCCSLCCKIFSTHGIYKLETLILGICWARHSIFLKQTFSRYFLFSNTTL